eukprot:SAG11_NODE_1155_length_5660_cov_6.290955_9_plen_102_part_00
MYLGYDIPHTAIGVASFVLAAELVAGRSYSLEFLSWHSPIPIGHHGAPDPANSSQVQPEEATTPVGPPYRVLLERVPVLQLLDSCTVLFFFVLDLRTVCRS